MNKSHVLAVVICCFASIASSKPMAIEMFSSCERLWSEKKYKEMSLSIDSVKDNSSRDSAALYEVLSIIEEKNLGLQLEIALARVERLEKRNDLESRNPLYLDVLKRIKTRYERSLRFHHRIGSTSSERLLKMHPSHNKSFKPQMHFLLDVYSELPWVLPEESVDVASYELPAIDINQESLAGMEKQICSEGLSVEERDLLAKSIVRVRFALGGATNLVASIVKPDVAYTYKYALPIISKNESSCEKTIFDVLLSQPNIPLMAKQLLVYSFVVIRKGVLSNEDLTLINKVTGGNPLLQDYVKILIASSGKTHDE